MAFCTECGKEFEATKENSVNIKILGRYGTVCRPCYLKLKREKKIKVLKQGEKGALV